MLEHEQRRPWWSRIEPHLVLGALPLQAKDHLNLVRRSSRAAPCMLGGCADCIDVVDTVSATRGRESCCDHEPARGALTEFPVDSSFAGYKHGHVKESERKRDD